MTIEIEEFKVIGISVRTINKNGQSQNDIGNLWGKFMGQNLIDKVPNKLAHEIYCIYTDYENDFNGQYTTIIGCKVNSFENIPEGLTTWTIPTTKYKVYKSIGKLPECVMMTWTNIWHSDINRKCVADFDVYGQKAQNWEHAEVDTYVSIE